MIVLKGLENLTMDEFDGFCSANEPYRIERQSDGSIVMEPPTHYFTGMINSKLIYFLTAWCLEHNAGVTFDSNTGFSLDDGSILSPDAAWISSERSRQLPQSEKHKFAKICPDFIVELRSQSDQKNRVLKKMEQWLINRVKLAWMIDPYEERAYIFRKDRPVELIKSFENKLTGDPLMPGFILELKHFKTDSR